MFQRKGSLKNKEKANSIRCETAPLPFAGYDQEKFEEGVKVRYASWRAQATKPVAPDMGSEGNKYTQRRWGTGNYL